MVDEAEVVDSVVANDWCVVLRQLLYDHTEAEFIKEHFLCLLFMIFLLGRLGTVLRAKSKLLLFLILRRVNQGGRRVFTAQFGVFHESLKLFLELRRFLFLFGAADLDVVGLAGRQLDHVT